MKRAFIILSAASLVFLLGAADSQTIRVKGRGLAPPETSAGQARILAKRAAVLDGYKQLAIAAGFAVETEEGGREVTEVQAYLKGFTVLSTNYVSDHEAEVEIEMPVSAIITNVAEYKQKKLDRKFAEDLRARLESIEKDLARLQAELKQVKDMLTPKEDTPK